MDREDRTAMLWSRLLSLATLLAGAGYLVWVFRRLNPAHPVVASLFFLAEVSCFALFAMATFAVWRLRFKPAEGLGSLQPHSVDVFITVFREPFEVVKATVEAATAIEWDGVLTVYVLDDGNAEPVRQLAERCGARYLSRPDAGVPVERAKAGNLNFGLAASNGELILVLDADQVPLPGILTALAGYMKFPSVAFIQSRQRFLVPEGDPFFNLDRVFYQAVQLGYDSRDAALSCGSGVLYRRAALSETKGFASWNVVEDLTTSYELHSKGWRSFYFPHALTTGLAPADIWGVYRQRSQWALDTIRLFFWDLPLFKRGLRWQARMGYLMLPLSYISAGWVFPLFFVIPLWTYITGGSVLAGSELEFVIVRGSYCLAMAAALRILFRRHQAGRQFQMLVGLFPVYMLATLRAVLHPPRRQPTYTPNNAEPGRRRRRSPIVAVLPQLLLVAANAILPFYAILAQTAEPRLILGNALVSAVSIWSVLPTVIASLERPVWSRRTSPSEFYAPTPQSDY